MKKNIFHKISLTTAALLAAACCLGLAAPSFAGQLITIGAAPMGGTYYPAGIALADIISKYIPGMDARVEVTGGTMENPTLMQMGELQMGLANADVAYFAHKGMPPFNTPFTDIRAMFSGLAPGVVQYAVLEDSGIKTIKDLAGKRVAVGPQGNSSGLLFQKILDFYGMDASKITRSYISFADGINELLDRHVDMAIVQAGIPAPGLQEAFASSSAVRIISFPEKERDAFLEKYPYYIPYRIPKTSYAGLPEDVVTFATQNTVLVHASLSEDTVYAITKAVFEHLPDLYAAHPALRSVTLSDAAKTPIPLHQGAAKFFKETPPQPDGM